MGKIPGGEKISGKKKCVGGWHHAVVERRREEDAALGQRVAAVQRRYGY